MKNNYITVRPPVEEGESLTSYLFRIAELNGKTMIDFWYEFHISNKHSLRLNQMARFDYDFSIIDYFGLAVFLKLSLDQVMSMTMQVIYMKFFDESSKEIDRILVMINNEFEKSNRKFCPKCLAEKGKLYLIWQIKDIGICQEHLVRLQSVCLSCGTEIKYNDDILTHKKCHNPKCEESLEKKFELVKEIEYIKEQDYLFNEWKFLLDPTKQLTDKYAKLQLEQSLAIKALYFLQSKAKVYIRKNIKILSPALVKSLVSMIRGASTIKKIFTKDLFQIIRGLGIGLE